MNKIKVIFSSLTSFSISFVYLGFLIRFSIAAYFAHGCCCVVRHIDAKQVKTHAAKHLDSVKVNYIFKSEESTYTWHNGYINTYSSWFINIMYFVFCVPHFSLFFFFYFLDIFNNLAWLCFVFSTY